MSLAERIKEIHKLNDNCMADLGKTHEFISIDLGIELCIDSFIHLYRRDSLLGASLPKYSDFSLSAKEALRTLNWLKKYEKELIELAKEKEEE